MTDTPFPLSRCSSVTRRRFLSTLGASVAVASAGAYGVSVWGRSPDGTGIPAVGTPTTTTTGTPIPAGTIGAPAAGNRTLIVIEMGGGNDALNMVVPHTNSRYYELRADLAITEPIDLDGDVGLHPALPFVADRYQTGEVAIVEGVGYPNPDLSHFASMATWWSGTHDASVGTGWLGRYLDGTVGAGDPLAGVTIGPGPTPALLGDTSFQVSVRDMTGLSPRIPQWVDTRDELMGLWQGFAPAVFDGADALNTVRNAIEATGRAKETLNDLLGAPQVSDPAVTARGQRSDLARSIEVAAALATSPVAPRVIYIHGWGDFDTHEGQRDRHAEMMSQLNAAFEQLFAAVESAGVAERVIVMTTSEFGRRTASNGSGTDHGTAGSHFVLGSAVTGGRYGEPPSLSNLDARGNLVHTVDYRSLYSSILDGWMEAPAEALLEGNFEKLPLFT